MKKWFGPVKSVVAQHLQPIAFGPLGDVVHPWRLVAPQLSARNPADFSLFQHKNYSEKKLRKIFLGKVTGTASSEIPEWFGL